MNELKCLKDVGSEAWIVRSVFMVENEAVCLADCVKCLCGVDWMSVDVVGDEREIPMEEASPVVLREA